MRNVIIITTFFAALIIALAASEVRAQPNVPNSHGNPPLSPTGNQPAVGDHVKGKLLVKFRPGKAPEKIKEFLDSFGATREDRALIPELDIYEVRLPSLPGGADEHAYRRAFKDDSRDMVELVDVDRIFYQAATPNDPQYSSQWHLPKISAPAAWDTTIGLSTITIAILDGGVNGSHPDLAAKMVPGWNFYNNNSDTSDVNGHGTSVAGVVAAATNNLVGVAGVAWGPKIMPIRIAHPKGWAYGVSFAQGLVWAANNGARVANISFSNLARSPIIDAGAYYFQARGGVVVGGAGLYWDAPDMDDPYILSVGATDENDALASFSDIGNSVDVTAPGVNILTTDRNGGYTTVEGMSFATPIVAGVAALVMSVNPALSPGRIIETIKRSAVDLGTPGYDIQYGAGRVNAQAAVSLALSGGPPLTDRTLPSISITYPSPGITISGPRSFDGNVSDNVGVLSLNLLVDGVFVAFNSTGVGPYSLGWDSRSVANGPHTIQVEAIDTSWNRSSTQISVNVNNIDTSSPIIRLWCPRAVPNDVQSGTREISARTYERAHAIMAMVIDGTSPLGVIPDDFDYRSYWQTDYRSFWNTTTFSNGTHNLRVEATDIAGNFAYREFPITVSNNGTDITAPLYPTIYACLIDGNTPTFTWAPENDPSGVTYRLLVAYYNGIVDFTSPLIDVPGITSTTHTLTSGLPNGRYAWTVLAQDDAGNVDSCGAVAQFTIANTDSSPPPAPTLTAPANGVTTASRQPIFDWADVSDVTNPSGISYMFQFSNASNFSSLLVSDTTPVSNYDSVTHYQGPFSNGTYYWRVASRDSSNNQSAWSATRTLIINSATDTTPPPAPTLISPLTGSQIRAAGGRSVTFDWSDVSDPSGIVYELDGETWTSTNLVSSSYTEQSVPDGSYTWRVRAIDRAGNIGSWSSTWSVNADSTAPVAPALIAPANTAVLANGTPLFDWADATDPSSPVTYRLEISDINLVPEIYKVHLTSSSYTHPTILSPGIHYWRVGVDDARGNAGPFTARFSFRVPGDLTPPQAPVVVSPQNGTDTINTTPTFDWTNVDDPSGVTYRLQVDNSGASFASPEINAANLTQSLYTATTLSNGTYSWRVMATDGAGNPGPWSPVNIVTIGQSPPPFISASSPPNGFVDALEDRDATSGALLGTRDISITFSAAVTNVGGGAISLANFERKYYRGGTTTPIEVSAASADLGGGGVAPSVTLVSGTGAGPYLVRFSPRIPLAAWTQIKAINVVDGNGAAISTSTNRIVLGNLPMDVTQDGRVLGDDISRWLAIRNGGFPLPAALTQLMLLDQKRNGIVAGEDITRSIQLINGIGTFRVWNGFEMGVRP